MSESKPELPPVPPVGVKISTDLERRSYGIRARARWTDPSTKRRMIRTSIVPDEDAANAFFGQLRQSSTTGIDQGVKLSDYVASIGNRWMRGLDPTSTGDYYRAGLRLRVLPALGHLPVAGITTGMIDRTIDEWEKRHSASVIKNTIAPMVRVLDEAVRDDVIQINPAKNRSRRSLNKNALNLTALNESPRAHAIPDLATLTRLAEAVGAVHQSYSDHVLLAALLAARGSEVAGLRVGDIDWRHRVVTIERQIFPGYGGLVTKQPKGRQARQVPILKPLEPVLKRLTAGRATDEPLLRGPRGGVLTSATVRDATGWDALVAGLGLPDLTRHGLRHTGATWMADSGIPLHVLQKILGHQSLETTRKYLHADHRHLALAAKQANAFLANWSPSGPPSSQRRIQSVKREGGPTF